MNVYYVSGIPYSDELYHYGILGQKWGIRRYQNPDGTRTEEGKIRYGSGKSDSSFVRGLKRLKDHQIDKIKNKHTWMMSDEELNLKTQRINRERAYLQAVSDIKKMSQGRRVLASIIERGANTIGDKLFNKIATNITTDEIDKENTKLRRLLDNRDLKKKLDTKDDKGTIAKLTDIMNNPSKYSNSEIKDAAETLGKLSSGKKLISTLGFDTSSDHSSASSSGKHRTSAADMYVRYSKSIPRSSSSVSSTSSAKNINQHTYSPADYIKYSNDKRRKLLYGPGGTAYR